MSPIKHINVVLVLLGVLLVSVKSEPEAKAIKEVDNLFAEIQEDHDKLKKVIKEMILSKDSSKCQCVPFYLCNAEDGTIITDGTDLIKSRRGGDDDENPCEDEQDICCMPPDIILSPKINSAQQKIGKCGYGMKSSDPSNEEYAEFGEYPWTVMIANLQEGRGKYKCVGSLIHPSVVLTAAHCADETKSILVRAGDLNTRTNDEPKPHQFRTISKVIKHPKLEMANLRYNVALLVTETPFDLDEHINTACLADSLPESNANADECVVTGWGVDRPDGSYSSIMRKIRFLLIDSERCQADFRKSRLGRLFRLHKTFACAYNKYGSDACEGNGGAPLVCPLVNQPRRYQQVGITSWGLDCAGNDPSVFTNIPELKDWIDQQFDVLNFNKDYYTYEDERDRYY